MQRIGVVNQTTQLATDTQAISDYLKSVIQQRYQLTEETINTHFAETRDTLCYATNDNQTAVNGMLNADADIALVIGGYNSSNTSHLVELCEKKIPTYFIDSADRILNQQEIIDCNWETKKQRQVNGFLPINNPARILITSGASCPDAMVEAVIRKLLSLFKTKKTVEDMIEAFT